MVGRDAQKVSQPEGRALRSAARKAASGRIAASPARAAARARASGSASGTVIMQARVDANFARTLTEQDAVVLGLDGTSALVREGLRLVHERAREAAMVAAYDEFYADGPAPLPTGVAAADADQ